MSKCVKCGQEDSDEARARIFDKLTEIERRLVLLETRQMPDLYSGTYEATYCHPTEPEWNMS